MSSRHDPIDGLYSLANETSYDAQISRRDRNWFLIGFVSLESLTTMVKILGVDVPPGIFALEAGVTLLPAGASEFSRRLSLHMSRDFREGGRELVELDMITDDSSWSQILQEPRNIGPTMPD